MQAEVADDRKRERRPRGSSEVALKNAEKSGPHIALVDVECPQINGYYLTQRLRMLPSLKSTSFIAVTRQGQVNDQTRGDRAGFSRHLAKPIELSVLQSLLGPLLLESD